MLHVLAITIRQIVHTFVLPVENSQKVQQDYLSKKEFIWLLF